MRNFKLLCVLALSALLTVSCTGGNKQVEEPSYPMFWSWWNYRPNPDRPANLDSIFKSFKDVGLDGIILNCKTEEYAEVVPFARKHGIEIWSWWWGLNLEHDRADIMAAHPDWFEVNRLGESLGDPNHRAYVDYYRFLCPALPEVREYLKGKIASVAKIDGVGAVVIDYTRFVDVILPTTLWSRYDVVQDREYAEFDYGYHPYLVAKFMAAHPGLGDPRTWDDPSEGERGEVWLQFRCDQVVELVNEMAEVVHSYGKKMSASPFPTPAMSRRMVRQDWGKWNLDVVFPMIYQNYYTGDPSFIADCTIENVKTANSMTTVMAGLTAINGPMMFEGMDNALNNGAKGIALFTIGSLRDPEIRARFKTYTDSVRAARASGVKPALTGITTVDVNGFNKPVIMGYVDNRMAHYLSMGKAIAALNLNWATVEPMTRNPIQGFTTEDFISRMRSVGAARNQAASQVPSWWLPFVNATENNLPIAINRGTPVLDRAWRTTRYYKVTEQNSGVVFKVDFYLYGDLVSGWNVEPEFDSFNDYIRRSRGR